MWCVGKALIAAPFVWGVLLAATTTCHAADTRPDDRGDWFRDPDSRTAAARPIVDAADPAPAAPRDREPATREDTPRDRDLRDRDLRDRDLRDRDHRNRLDDADLRRGPVRPPYAGGSGGGGYGDLGEYPSYGVNDWVNASARAATARAMFRRAQSELDASIRRAQRDFEKSRAYKQSVAGERDAYDAYLASRSHALRNLADDSRYQSLVQLRSELGERIARRRAAKDISKDELLAMATLKMVYASQARAMEVSALNSDAAMKDARDKMVVASKRVSQMEEDFDDSIRDNPEILMARRNLEDARVSVIATSAYANSAQVAGNAALDYAYYLHRNDIPRWDTGGGYGYSSPYWVRN